MNTNPETLRDERRRSEPARSRELTEQQLAQVVGGEGVAGTRRPL